MPRECGTSSIQLSTPKSRVNTVESTLSACIVVKDGKASILRCLDALEPAVDEIVVIDTGSSDGTIELVDAWKTKHPGMKVVHDLVGDRFHDIDGIFDFGAAKNYAVSRATCGYIMWVDCNDMLSGGRSLRRVFRDIVKKNPLSSITMYTRVQQTFRFPRKRICPREYARFDGSIHECLVNTAEGASEQRIEFEFINYKPTRDIARNIRSLDREWRLRHTVRCAFYMGNSYKDIGDIDAAITWYRIAVDEFPGTKTETRYKAFEELCKHYLHTGDYDNLSRRALEMIEERGTRPEGYYYRAARAYHLKEYPLAIKNLNKVLECLDIHRNSKLYLDPAIYDKERIEWYIRDAEDHAKLYNTPMIMPEKVVPYI